MNAHSHGYNYLPLEVIHLHVQINFKLTSIVFKFCFAGLLPSVNRPTSNGGKSAVLFSSL